MCWAQVALGLASAQETIRQPHWAGHSTQPEAAGGHLAGISDFLDGTGCEIPSQSCSGSWHWDSRGWAPLQLVLGGDSEHSHGALWASHKVLLPSAASLGWHPTKPLSPSPYFHRFQHIPLQKLSLRGGECSRLDDPAWSGQCHVKGAGAGMWVLPPTLR